MSSFISRIKYKIKDGFEDIFHRFNERVAKMKGRETCHNLLDLRLNNCSQCIAATSAGSITIEAMRGRYGMPKRHTKCGCTVIFDKGDWDTTVWDAQIAYLEESYDLKEIDNKWQEKRRKQERSFKEDDFEKDMKELKSITEKFLDLFKGVKKLF
jgi:hypothetical protein